MTTEAANMRPTPWHDQDDIDVPYCYACNYRHPNRCVPDASAAHLTVEPNVTSDDVAKGMTTTLLVSDYLSRDLESGYVTHILGCGTTAKYGQRTLYADAELDDGTTVRYFEQSHVLTYGEISEGIA